MSFCESTKSQGRGSCSDACRSYPAAHCKKGLDRAMVYMASWEQNGEESTQGGTAATPVMDLKGSVHHFSRALEEFRSASQRAGKDQHCWEFKMATAIVLKRKGHTGLHGHGATLPASVSRSCSHDAPPNPAEPFFYLPPPPSHCRCKVLHSDAQKQRGTG